MLNILKKSIAAAALMVCASSLHAENWPQFRGPSGQGESPEKNLPLKWSNTENVTWKTEIPGVGWSSPIVWGNQVFLTYASEDGVACHVVGIDRRDGKIQWDAQVFKQTPTRKEGKNSHATPTAVTDGKLVYAVFKEGGIVALTLDGTVAWTNLDHPFYNQHGMGASPIIYKDLLILGHDASAQTGDLKMGWQKPWDQAYLLALDAETGKQRWKTMRGMSRIGHTTPRVIEVDGKTQILSGAGDVLQRFDPESGKLLWTAKNIGESVVPTPVFGDGMWFTQSGWMDITIRAWRFGGTDDSTRLSPVWELKKGVPTIPSYAFHDHRLYTLKEDGVLQCLEAASGNLLWKQRLDGQFDASPILADGRIYFLSEEGVTTVISDGPEFKVLATNPLNEPAQASMAVSDGQLFIRTKSHLFCIGTGHTASANRSKGQAVEDARIVDGGHGLDRTLPEVTFDRVAFSDVIDFLRDIRGAGFRVDYKHLEKAGVHQDTPITMSLKNWKFSKGLQDILDVAGKKEKLEYFVNDDGIIVITTKAAAGEARESKAGHSVGPVRRIMTSEMGLAQTELHPAADRIEDIGR